jgi:hypothetical protein
LYFPLFRFNWPEWLPYLGGDSFHFFSAIFNIADSSIFIGVMILFIWQKKFFPESTRVKRDQANLSAVPEQEEADLNMQNAIEGTEEDCCIPE